MLPRDPHEEHRAASSLELFFDLVFVVAVSFASVELAHQLEDGHFLSGVGAYAMVFFAIWWAWMNFTWFATSFDTDDWLYRVTTIVQMAGVLILASGVTDAMVDYDYRLVTAGYVVMRLAMVSQWIRAGLRNSEFRATATRYAVGITLVQVLWVARLALPDSVAVVSFVVLVAAEISVPVLSERSGRTPLHGEHIAERYGLFTLILLGESLLASATAIVGGISEHDHTAELVGLAMATLVVVATMWWLYFSVSQEDSVGARLGRSLGFGYTHYVVFAAAGAVSAGIEVAVAHIEGGGSLSDRAASATITVPVALFVFCFWALAIRPRSTGIVNVATPVGALAVLAATAIPGSAIVSAAVAALILAAVVAVSVVFGDRGATEAHSSGST
ncbi:low temperature requirement protein A [Rhodococcus sp. BP-349]|nr:low temperature requirement protein A [Rhodococcus sp. BP-363]MBY6542718.1 low temperature requirement protein A [Rhodococcus sp. BP-369]MBY6561948.1 low temperature requirement protein A [Rhodococcus sp. BP-370]MBY6576240.1 low temperature requirement protein A [Rhodococcus sp. BP-364]MBY6585541.1 low temperature requirement protein A [Rhodococcus sp. BP-358]MBY6589878.1 low temperature requirement protein A [Rhodococcus sp. BP-362]MBY6593589.1 low temperature requirement protein A [Rhodo